MVNFSNSYFHPIFSCYHLCGKVMFSNNNQRLQIHIFQLQIDSPSLFSCTPTKVSAMHNRCLNLPGLPPRIFNYSALQTSTQARTCVCHLCTKAQYSIHSLKLPCTKHCAEQFQGQIKAFLPRKATYKQGPPVFIH